MPTKEEVEKIANEMVNTDTDTAVHLVMNQVRKLSSDVLQSEVLGKNPIIATATLLTAAEQILEVAILIDHNLFKDASKAKIIKSVEDLYAGKGKLQSTMPSMQQFENKQSS